MIGASRLAQAGFVVALLSALAGAAKAQQGHGRAGGEVEVQWAANAYRAGDAGRLHPSTPYFGAAVPPTDAGAPGAQASPLACAEPTLFVDLPGGGRVVAVSAAPSTRLLRVPVDRPLSVGFGPWLVLSLSVFDHDDNKLFEGTIVRPQGRLILSLRPGWDDARCRRSLDHALLIGRAAAGDEPAARICAEMGRTSDDRVVAALLAEYGDRFARYAPAPSQQPAYPPPGAPPGPSYPQPTTGPAPTPAPPTPPPPPAPVACPKGEFDSFMKRLDGAPFADEKNRLLTSFAGTRWFSVAQVGAIARSYSFSQEKLDAIRRVNERIVDRQNFFSLYDVFSFDHEKDKLREIEASWPPPPPAPPKQKPGGGRGR